MEKMLLAIVGVIVLVFLGIGLIYSINKEDSSNTATTTPKVVVNNNTNTVVTNVATKPTVVTSSSVFSSDTTVIVNGTVNPKGTFTSYWYEYGNTANLGNKNLNQTVGSGFVSIQAPGYITNLSKNTIYYYRLVAENQYGRVVGEQYSFRTTEGTQAPVGSAPTVKTLSASGVSRTTVNINGEVIPNKAGTQYWFEYGKSPELGDTSAFANTGDNNVKMSVSISLSDLEPLTTYYFRLNAQNQFGTINGSILNFKTLGPTVATAPKVESQNATAITDSGARLNGKVTPSGAETKYWFEYSKDTLLGSVLMTTTPKVSVGSGSSVTEVNSKLLNLSSKTTYYFRIVAENSVGITRGSEMTFKTK